MRHLTSILLAYEEQLSSRSTTEGFSSSSCHQRMFSKASNIALSFRSCAIMFGRLTMYIHEGFAVEEMLNDCLFLAVLDDPWGSRSDTIPFLENLLSRSFFVYWQLELLRRRKWCLKIRKERWIHLVLGLKDEKRQSLLVWNLAVHILLGGTLLQENSVLFAQWALL